MKGRGSKGSLEEKWKIRGNKNSDREHLLHKAFFTLRLICSVGKNMYQLHCKLAAVLDKLNNVIEKNKSKKLDYKCMFMLSWLRHSWGSHAHLIFCISLVCIFLFNLNCTKNRSFKEKIHTPLLIVTNSADQDGNLVTDCLDIDTIFPPWAMWSPLAECLKWMSGYNVLSYVMSSSTGSLENEYSYV